MWSFDLRTMRWQQHELTGDIPTGRHSYEMCLLPYVDNNNNFTPYLLLFGGNSNVYSSSNLSDTYMINVTTMHSQRIVLSCHVSQYNQQQQFTHYTTRTDLPSGRWAANMVVVSDYVLLYGGYRSQRTPSDFSLKHIYTLNWRQLIQYVINNVPTNLYWYRHTTHTSTHVPARTFSCSYVIDQSHIVLYGGANKGIPLNEMLVLA